MRSMRIRVDLIFSQVFFDHQAFLEIKDFYQTNLRSDEYG